MATFLDNATDWLSSQLMTADGKPAVYYRGSRRVSVTVVKILVTVQRTDLGGQSIEGQRVDWIVTASELTWDGQLQTPEAGDRIEILEGVSRNTYEVQPASGTDSHYRPRAGGTYRVHSRLINEA